MGARLAHLAGHAPAVPERARLKRSELVESAAGTAFGAIFGVVAALRRSKPLHPKGALLQGILRRHGSQPPWGVPWLDAPGDAAVLVRVSRSVGLPAPLPDIYGVAVRLPHDSSPADLLLATTGRGPVGRYLLQPRQQPNVFCSTLFPYRTDRSPVLLAAVPRSPRRRLPADPAALVDAVRDEPWRLDLAAATPRGLWRRFATLEITGPAADESDPAMSFDPVRNVLPGFGLYDWSVRLREPSYAAGRAGDPRR